MAATGWSGRLGRTAVVDHLDDEGTDLGDGCKINVWAPLSIGYYGGRVYVTTANDYDYLVSYQTGGGDTDPGKRQSDFESNTRFGADGGFIRVGADGVAVSAFGEANKIATLDVASVPEQNPFYPQMFMGAGIDALYSAQAGWETCDGATAPVAGEPNGGRCGTQNGKSGPDLGWLSSPIDVATGRPQFSLRG
jgi:hypothetical protein